MAVNDSEDVEMVDDYSRRHRGIARSDFCFADCFILYKLIDMLRGRITFKCQACGHVFEGLDIEDRMTAASMPMPCQKCGAQCLPKQGGWLSRLLGL